MKIQTQPKHTNKRSWIIAISSAVVLVLCAVGYYYLVFVPNYDPTDSYTPVYPVETSNQSTAKDKDSIASDNTTTAEDVPKSVSGSIVIDDLNQKNGYVNIKATVSNFTPTQCVYSFTINGGKPVIKEQTGTCTGLSISQEEFDRIGTYTVTATAYSSSEKITATQTIEIK